MYIAVLRLWTGGAAVWVVLLLVGAINAMVQAPQTNDATELIVMAAISAAVGLFGVWVLRGFKGQTR